MTVSWSDLPLTEEHREFLENQALTPGIVSAHGVRSVTDPGDLPEGFTAYGSRILPAIVFPWTEPDGTVRNQLRPAPGTVEVAGRPAKYIWSKGEFAELGVIREHPADRSMLVVEGTKQSLVAGAYAPSGYSVYGIAGCRSWSSDGVPSPHLAKAEGRDVIILLDADCSSNREVYDAGVKLKEALEMEGAASVRFAPVPGGQKSGLDDLLAKRPESARQEYLERILGKAANKPASKAPKERTSAEKRREEAEAQAGRIIYLEEQDRYQVDVGGDTQEVLNNLVECLVKKFDQDRLFNYGGELAQRKGSEMKPLTKDSFLWPLTEAIRTVRMTREGELVDVMPEWTHRSALLAEPDNFSRLNRLSSTPFLRSDGTVCQKSGYDEETKTFLSLSEEMESVSIADEPSRQDVERAVSLIRDDLLQGFPFATESDFANAVALVLTPFIRGMVPTVPLAAVDGQQPGVGKNLFAEVVSLITTGRELDPLPYSPDDEEQRKLITSAFRAGSEIFCFDEAHEIGGRSLAKALTSAWWGDRILGGSDMGSYPNNVTWISLGNQVRVSGDLGRRMYRIHLAYDGENPEARPLSYYRHPELKDWTREHRQDLITACLTICRYWFSQGQPAGRVPSVLGSFEKWQHIISGILTSAGVHGFMENVKNWRSESDYDHQHWVAHLNWLYETFGNEVFTANEVRQRYMQDPDEPQPPPGLEDASQKDYVRRLGIAYGQQKGRVTEGFRLNYHDKSRKKTNLWSVTYAGSTDDFDPPPWDEGPDDGGPGPAPDPAPESEPAPEPGDELVFDIETCGAEELWSRDDFARLSGYESGGNPVITEDHGELVSKIRDAGTCVGHNILNFDLVALSLYHGLDYEEAAAKAVDTLITARQADPPVARSAANGYHDLNQVAQRLGVEGKTDDIKKLKRKYGGYDKIPIDVLTPYLKGDLSSTRGVYEKLKADHASDPYIKREHRVAARMARASIEGFRVDEELLKQRLAEQQERKKKNLGVLSKKYGIPLLDAKGEPSKSPLATDKGKAALVEAFRAAGALHYPKTEKKGTIATSKDDMDRMVEIYSDPAALKKARIDPGSVDLDAVKEICELVTDVTSERTVYGTIRNHTVDGRVHPNISPEQASGRWSVTSPGLTVLGKRGGKWREREVLVADEGCVLVAVDLDQVDARAVAGHCQDPEFMALFEPGRDFHSEVAQRVFGRSDGEYRERAKVGSHGYSYGLGAGGLASQMGVELAKAYEFINSMQEQFPIHADWQARVREQAEAGLLLDNGFGRKMRPDPERAYTQGPGLIGQGATRDIIAEGVLNLPAEIVPMLRVVIHDELVFCLPEDRAEELSERIMQAMKMDFFGVPITAGRSRFGRSWGELYDKG